jgi:hypothetical protein
MQHDQHLIKAYLLGDAPEHKTQRFDELSVADDNFVDVLCMVEDNLVDDYICGDLSGSELNRFESYYLASPRRRQKVEFARAFRQFANAHSRANSASEVEATPSKNGFLSGLLRFSTLQWGFAAATIILTAAAGWLAWQNLDLRRQTGEAVAMRNAAVEREQELRKQLDGQAPITAGPEIAEATNNEPPPEVGPQSNQKNSPAQANVEQSSPTRRSVPKAAPRLQIATFILTPPVRSGNRLAEFSFPSGIGEAVFKIKMEPNEFKTHQVELVERSSGRAIWKSGLIRPATDTVSVKIPRKLFTSGIYSFQVTGISGSGDSEMIGDYYFRISK